jgi:hypothetical protein
LRNGRCILAIFLEVLPNQTAMMDRSNRSLMKFRWIVLAPAALALVLATRHPVKDWTKKILGPDLAPSAVMKLAPPVIATTAAAPRKDARAEASAARDGRHSRRRSSARAATTRRTDVSAPARSGMIVAIDPETGALGAPSPEQARALASAGGEALERSSDGLVEIHRPDGAVGVNLQGRFQEYAWVRIGPSGKPIFGCIQSDGRSMPDSVAARALADSLGAPPKAEEE